MKDISLLLVITFRMCFPFNLAFAKKSLSQEKLQRHFLHCLELIVIELLSCTKHNAGQAMDRVFLGFCEQLHYFSHADLVAIGQNPMIEGSIIVILSQQNFHQAFPLPTVCVQCRSLITCGTVIEVQAALTCAETLPPGKVLSTPPWSTSGSVQPIALLTTT